MLGAIFFWDIKAGTPLCGQRYTYQRFDYACRGFGVDKIVIVDELSVFPLETQDTIVSSLIEAVSLFDGYEKIYLDKSGSNMLLDYKHPKNAVYIVGGDYSSMVIPEGSAAFRIDMVEGTDVELWADQALAMALAHRHATVS